MRTSTAYFAGAGTVAAAIVLGLGGGLLFSNIVSMPRTNKGNWTISLRSVAPDALWEASDIVADIQEAYDLAVAA